MPPASVIGRVGKFAVGAFQLSFVYAVAAHLASIVHTPPANGFWIFVVWAFWLVAPAVNIGLIHERTLGSRPRWWVAAVFLVIVGVGHLVTGTWWSLPVAVSVITFAVVIQAYVGLSHVASAVLGFPGCELRALAYLLARAHGAESSFAACPGAWTPLDHWEARVREGRDNRGER